MKKGIYLVVDPGKKDVLDKLKKVINPDLTAVQIWDNFKDVDVDSLIPEIVQLCKKENVSVLINNRWDWIKGYGFDGVHFDKPPVNLEDIRQLINPDSILGVTCNNDLEIVRWAEDKKLHYLSFCSMFPSSTSNSCEMVAFENVRIASNMTSVPIFLAGGISPYNVNQLEELDYSGIVVVSGIMGADEPMQAFKNYSNEIKI